VVGIRQHVDADVAATVGTAWTLTDSAGADLAGSAGVAARPAMGSIDQGVHAKTRARGLLVAACAGTASALLSGGALVVTASAMMPIVQRIDASPIAIDEPDGALALCVPAGLR
jgi:hypothetical protein